MSDLSSSSAKSSPVARQPPSAVLCSNRLASNNTKTEPFISTNWVAIFGKLLAEIALDYLRLKVMIERLLWLGLLSFLWADYL